MCVCVSVGDRYPPFISERAVFKIAISLGLILCSAYIDILYIHEFLHAFSPVVEDRLTKTRNAALSRARAVAVWVCIKISQGFGNNAPARFRRCIYLRAVIYCERGVYIGIYIAAAFCSHCVLPLRAKPMHAAAAAA